MARDVKVISVSHSCRQLVFWPLKRPLLGHWQLLVARGVVRQVNCTLIFNSTLALISLYGHRVIRVVRKRLITC